jgi:biotin synthase
VSKTIFLCAISNTSSGSCSENCKFCTQSATNNADIEKYKYKDISVIVDEAKQASENGATGFCLVTAGKGLDDKKVAFISRAARAVKSELKDINLIACNGTATLAQLQELKKSGVDSYNHNLETAESFYPNLCTTHTWQERFQTCLNVKEAGLNLVTGGIFGLGESEEDRVSFIASLKKLNPKTVPINFFHPNPALPLKAEPLSIDKALELVKWVREELPEVKLMAAGGREITFKGRQSEIFEAGVNAIVIGNYLTTPGAAPDQDRTMIESLGHTVASTCNG